MAAGRALTTALSAMVLLLIAYMSASHLDVVRSVLGGAEATGRPPNYLRNGLELTSFAATTLLFATALVALWFTVAQIGEAQRSRVDAEKTRVANLYLQITALWSADKAVASRMWVIGLADRFSNEPDDDPLKSKASGYLSRYITLTIEQELKHGRTATLDHIYILTLLENLGVLCERRYVNTADIVQFIASPIDYQMDLLADYIKAKQKEQPTNSSTRNCFTRRQKRSSRSRTKRAVPPSLSVRPVDQRASPWIRFIEARSAWPPGALYRPRRRLEQTAKAGQPTAGPCRDVSKSRLTSCRGGDR